MQGVRIVDGFGEAIAWCGGGRGARMSPARCLSVLPSVTDSVRPRRYAGGQGVEFGYIRALPTSVSGAR